MLALPLLQLHEQVCSAFCLLPTCLSSQFSGSFSLKCTCSVEKNPHQLGHIAMPELICLRVLQGRACWKASCMLPPSIMLGGCAYTLIFAGHRKSVVNTLCALWPCMQWGQCHACCCKPSTHTLNASRSAADSLAMTSRSSAAVLHARTALMSSLRSTRIQS